MKVNPYYLKDIDGEYYNKYPEFQIWENAYKAGMKKVVAWINKQEGGLSTTTSFKYYLVTDYALQAFQKQIGSRGQRKL